MKKILKSFKILKKYKFILIALPSEMFKIAIIYILIKKK